MNSKTQSQAIYIYVTFFATETKLVTQAAAPAQLPLFTWNKCLMLQTQPTGYVPHTGIATASNYT